MERNVSNSSPCCCHAPKLLTGADAFRGTFSGDKIPAGTRSQINYLRCGIHLFLRYCLYGEGSGPRIPLEFSSVHPIVAVAGSSGVIADSERSAPVPVLQYFDLHDMFIQWVNLPHCKDKQLDYSQFLQALAKFDDIPEQEKVRAKLRQAKKLQGEETTGNASREFHGFRVCAPVAGISMVVYLVDDLRLGR